MKTIMMDEITNCCDKLDKNVKYSDSLKNISCYLQKLVTDINVIQYETITINKEFIESCIDMVKSSYIEKNINVDIICCQDYKTNYNKLVVQQVFLNLISNAYKYNVDNGFIFIKLFVDGDKLIVDIKNSMSKSVDIESNQIGLKYISSLLNNPKIHVKIYKNKIFTIRLCLYNTLKSS